MARARIFGLVLIIVALLPSDALADYRQVAQPSKCWGKTPQHLQALAQAADRVDDDYHRGVAFAYQDAMRIIISDCLSRE